MSSCPTSDTIADTSVVMPDCVAIDSLFLESPETYDIIWDCHETARKYAPELIRRTYFAALEFGGNAAPATAEEWDSWVKEGSRSINAAGGHMGLVTTTGEPLKQDKRAAMSTRGAWDKYRREAATRTATIFTTIDRNGTLMCWTPMPLDPGYTDSEAQGVLERHFAGILSRSAMTATSFDKAWMGTNQPFPSSSGGGVVDYYTERVKSAAQNVLWENNVNVRVEAVLCPYCPR